LSGPAESIVRKHQIISFKLLRSNVNHQFIHCVLLLPISIRTCTRSSPKGVNGLGKQAQFWGVWMFVNGTIGITVGSLGWKGGPLYDGNLTRMYFGRWPVSSVICQQ
jgi:hypothetical protein